jgi:hypothetical protein
MYPKEEYDVKIAELIGNSIDQIKKFRNQKFLVRNGK